MVTSLPEYMVIDWYVIKDLSNHYGVSVFAIGARLQHKRSYQDASPALR